MAIEFLFTEEQKLWRETCRNVIQKEFAPKAHDIDEAERYPEEDIKLAAELGWMGVTIPEKYGGVELGEVGFCILMEELCRAGCSSHAEILGVQNGIGGTPIVMFGTEEQKQKYLPKLAKGELIAAFALTEPQAGSDAANIQLSADKEGDHYILNGTKLWITNGPVADIIITMAVTDKALGPVGGVTAFIVEKDMPGFSVGTIEKKMGNRGSKTGELIYDNVKVPKENILGDIGAGFIVALATLDDGRVTLGAGCLGTMKGTLDLATKFAMERIQFGKPIIENQAIQWMLVDMASYILASEYMVYHTAVLVDQVREYRLRGEQPPRELRELLTRNASIVKFYTSERACECVDKCLQIHGGMGYMRHYPVERMYRDVRITRIYEGTNEIQRIIVARDIMNRGGWGF